MGFTVSRDATGTGETMRRLAAHDSEPQKVMNRDPGKGNDVYVCGVSGFSRETNVCIEMELF